MAVPKTRFETNDANTRKKWARDLFKVILPDIEYSYLVGTSADSPVQMRTELSKGEGDELTFGIRYPLVGEPIIGRDTVEGNEERMIFKDFKLTIEEVNKAVDTGGKMEAQRIPWDLLSEGKSALKDWWTEYLSKLVIAHLCGDTGYLPGGKTLGQDPEAPDAYHAMTVNDVAEASQTAADELDLRFLDRMKQRAENPTGPNGVKIRHLKLKGNNYYRVILHNYVFDRLRTNTNVAQWGDLQRAAGKLGMPEVEISYNGMLVTKSERVSSLVTNVYKNVLLGAQAACLAWGGAGESKGTVMAFVPYTKDAQRFTMIRGGGILGCKVVSFYGENYGRIVGSSYATAL